jgi:DNA-directed RNA polymerase subunit H (RpoH/RPB5)
LDTLIKRIKNESVELDTENYFQRKDDLWDPTKQSRLIESILIRFPLPAFFFDASEESKWLIVDGLQRLSSVRNFCVKKSLKLTNMEFLTQLNGKTWDDLPEDLQRVIEETQVVIYKIMPGTPTDVKFNIFKRINTGGLVLEPQEIRHALLQGKPSKFMAELAKEKAFLEATQYKVKTHRMLDRDFANRFLGFYLFDYETYSSDLDSWMTKAMASINEKTEEEMNRITYDFAASMKLARGVFGNEAFRKVYWNYNRLPPINKALFDAIAAQFALISDEERNIVLKRKSSFKNQLKQLLANDPIMFAAVTSSTGDRGRVHYRHSKIKALILDVLKENEND